MSEDLKAIDQSLIRLEELLLHELRRLRKLDADTTYSEIAPDLMTANCHIDRALAQVTHASHCSVSCIRGCSWKNGISLQHAG